MKQDEGFFHGCNNIKPYGGIDPIHHEKPVGFLIV